jgi:hypothetical protein
MQTARFAIVLFLCAAGAAIAEDPVYFADPLLKAAVEEYLWITDPTPSDMLGLTELERVGDSDSDDADNISDLTGLEYAANLQTLNLRLNLISDISALAGLTNLESVDLSRNQIGDLSPLSGLTRLTSVNLHANNITDVSPLSNLDNVTTLILRYNKLTDLSALCRMKSLRELDLGDNPLGDLTPLSSITGLTTLCLWSNQIRDLTPLSSMTGLTTLCLWSNQISDLTPLSGLVNLQSLELNNNLIRSISPLCRMTSLSWLNLKNNPLSEEACCIHIPQIVLANPGICIFYDTNLLTLSSTRGGSVIVPGEGEYWYYNGARMWIEARADPGFLFAGWSGTCPSTENPLLLTLDRKHQMQANFVRPLDVLHVDDDAIGDTESGDSRGNDPNEDGTAEHPFNSIQEAIEVAGDGVAIVVDPGRYCESIDLLAKNVRLIGRDPNDTTPGSWPLIEGTDTEPAVSFCGNQTSECLLTGFVITRSSGQTAGAVYCDGASPTISNCLIVGNRTTLLNGAAVYCKNSQAVLTNCTIADNYAAEEGGGLTLIDSDVTVLNSILWNNLPHEILSTGTSTPDIRCCVVHGGWPGAGNLDENPLFARPGSWIDPDDPSRVFGPFGASLTWSVWADGDYHVQSQAGRWDPTAQNWVQDDATSACVDGGLVYMPVGNEPTPNGDRINLGIYGGTAEAGMSPTGF